VKSLDVAELVAREEIRDVMRRYVRGVDRYDLEAVRSCYHPDATDERGPYRGDVEGFLAYLDSERGLRMFERTMHCIADQSVEVHGDEALSESMAIGYHQLTEEHYLLGLRYVDRFERRGGEWRIAHRKVAYDWAIRRPIVDSDLLPEDFPRGVRGGGDVVYTHLLARFGLMGGDRPDPSAP
jgi:ketosteroid isomerase-like protein